MTARGKSVTFSSTVQGMRRKTRGLQGTVTKKGGTMVWRRTYTQYISITFLLLPLDINNTLGYVTLVRGSILQYVSYRHL